MCLWTQVGLYLGLQQMDMGTKSFRLGNRPGDYSRDPEFWGLLHQTPPPFAPCFWSRGGEEPDHNKNGFHRLLFVFYINRSGTDGMDGILWGGCWRGGSAVGARGEGTTPPPFCQLIASKKYYGLMLLSHIINPAFLLLGDVVGGREVVRSLGRPRWLTAQRPKVRIRASKLKYPAQHSLQLSRDRF